MSACALKAGEAGFVAGEPPPESTSGVHSLSSPPLRAPQIGSCSVAHNGVVPETHVTIALQVSVQ